MTTPFSFPFCPTPSPFFNILIKMMIPGIIKPVIDQITAAIIAAQESVQTMLLCMFPPMVFLEVSSKEDVVFAQNCTPKAHASSLQRAETSSFVETDSRTSGAPGGQKSGMIIQGLQKAYFFAEEPIIGAALTIDLSESLTVELHELLHSRLAGELATSLEVSLAHALHHYVGSAVGSAVSHSIASIMDRLMPRFIGDSLKSTVTHTITRALTHSVGSAVVESLLHEHQLHDSQGQMKKQPKSVRDYHQLEDARRFYCYECDRSSTTNGAVDERQVWVDT